MLNPDPAWRKSSHSAVADCIEVADLGDGLIGIRSSQNRPWHDRDEWAAFIAGVKAGEFDDLA